MDTIHFHFKTSALHNCSESFIFSATLLKEKWIRTCISFISNALPTHTFFLLSNYYVQACQKYQKLFFFSCYFYHLKDVITLTTLICFPRFVPTKGQKNSLDFTALCTSHLGKSLEGLSLFDCFPFLFPQLWKWEFCSYRLHNMITDI